MTVEQPLVREHGNAYNLFILVLTVFSLAIMAVLILPIDAETRRLLTFYDNVICLIFLADFAYNLSGSRPRSAYFVHQRGWLDLLGSIPSLEILPFTGLLRLARLSRLARIGRLLSGKNRSELLLDMINNRGQYATFITLLAAGMVLTVASVLVLQFESTSPDANITTAGDAIWWGVVTITTVGYGDTFPVTFLGRLVGVSVMVAGVGIIGALASILASLLVPPPDSDDDSNAADDASEASRPIAAELAELRAEIAALRSALEPKSARAASVKSKRAGEPTAGR